MTSSIVVLRTDSDLHRAQKGSALLTIYDRPQEPPGLASRIDGGRGPCRFFIQILVSHLEQGGARGVGGRGGGGSYHPAEKDVVETSQTWARCSGCMQLAAVNRCAGLYICNGTVDLPRVCCAREQTTVRREIMKEGIQYHQSNHLPCMMRREGFIEKREDKE